MRRLTVLGRPAFSLFLSAALAFPTWSQGPAHRTKLPVLVPQVIRELPHSTQAFTQGLVFHQGRLFESTGLYGRSSLRILDAATGRQVLSRPLDPAYFGEGLALLTGKLVQLTWREGVALVYPLDASGTPVASQSRFQYHGEGWGLTSKENRLYMSNGSDTLVVRDSLFRPVKRILVTLAGAPLQRLNELEFARGKIFSNVWHSDSIFIIDPGTGEVEGIVDCSSLSRRVGQVTGGEDVLNGIAWDSRNDLFYLTGKNWPKLFIVRLPR